MHVLKKEQISSWKRQKGGYNDNYFPGAINSNCPHCNALVSFSFTHWHKAPHGVAMGRTPCPSCDRITRFFLLDYDPTTQDFSENTSLWIYPPVKLQDVIPDMDDTPEICQQLVKAYASTISVFNSGEWNATAILIRRFLDGLLENGLGEPPSNLSLEEGLAKLAQNRDLSQPIRELTGAISDSDIAELLSLEDEPDKESAELMIELMNLLVTYLYIMPRRAQKLHEKARRMARNGAPTHENVVEIAASPGREAG